MRKTWYKGISFGLSFCMVASTFMTPVPALAKQPAVNVLRTEVLEEKLNDLTQDIAGGLTGTQDIENTENAETPQEPVVGDESTEGTEEPEIEVIGNGEIKTVTGGGAKVKVVTGSSLEVVPVSYGGIYETWKNAGGKPAGTQEVVTDDKGESWLHIVTSSENNNANSTHAFVTENGEFNAQEPVYLQATIKAGSSAADTRTGFYLNYSNDENGAVRGAFVGYDPGGWFWQIYDGKENAYYTGNREPSLEIGEEVTVKIEIKEDKMNVWLMKKDNTITKLFTDVPVKTIPQKTGKIAIKAAAWGTTNTDIYLKDIYYSNQQPSEVNKYNVTVQVIDDSQVSVAGATVELGGKKYITDGAGNITIEDCLPSKYQVYVQADGYEENSESITVTNENVTVTIEIEKQVLESISTNEMTAVVDTKFPRIIQYNMNNGSTFYGQTQKLDTITINGVDVKPTVTSKRDEDTITYTMTAKDNDNSIDAVITAEIKVYDNIVEFNITDIKDNKIVKTIEIKNHNLVSVRSDQENARIDGTYYLSTNTHVNGDHGVAVDETLNVAKEAKRGYLYAFVSNGSYSAGLWSNSENKINSDWQRVTATASQLRGDIKTVGLSSTYWTYQKSEDHRKEDGTLEYKDGTQLKVNGELPSTKIIITPDINGDNTADWQDGAIAYRKIMNNPLGSERVPNLVAYRICMNFGSQAQNPFLMTLDNVKKVYLNTDGLGQSILLKGYGSEGHDSGHLNYADIGTRIGGAEDMKYLLEKGAEYGATFGIHVNASETYPESKYFNNDILRRAQTFVRIKGEDSYRTIDDFVQYGWNWLDQGININADYDLRHGRADRWKDLIDALGGAPANQDGAGLDFIYVDVWGNGQSGDNGTWPSRQLAKELTTLGWRVAGEWGHANEYDSTFQHWAADLTYGGYGSKGINSTIARFIRNHQKDSWIGNYTSYGGAADAPLLGGYNMKDFEGWQGRSDYAAYINTLFGVNVPSKFVQHFEVMNWVDGYPVSMTDNGETYQWTPGMEATLTSLNQYEKDGNKSTLNIKRHSNDFKNDTTGYRTRTMTLDGKKVYEGYEGAVKYLIPWNWDENGNVLENSEEKLYHWNTTENKTSEWELPDSWQGLSTVKLYSLDDLGKTFVKEVTVKDNKIILDVDAKTPYVIYKGEAKPKEELNWSEGMHLSDVGFNSGSLTPYWTVSGGNSNAVIAKSQGANPMLKISDNTEKVTVSQKLTDLKPNTDYAIYVGVDNRSEAKAGIEIIGATGTKTKSETGTSIAKNYIKAYAHSTSSSVATVDNTSYFQNIYAFFTTGDDVSNVVVNLYKEAGDGASYFDDVRVVETKADNWDKWESEGIFTQNFENVVQGIYPFVIGDIEDVNDNRTHLAEKHVPYTQRGWNNDEFMNKMIDDVIQGNWSLKTNGLVQYQKLVYQTIPQNFTFEPGQSYTISFDYEAGGDGTYAFVVGDQPYENQQYSVRKDLSVTATEDPNDGKAKHFTFNVVGSETGQTWIGIYSTENAPDMHGLDELQIWNGQEWTGFSGSANFSGYKDFVLDNLEIRKVDVNKTKLWDAMEEVKGKIERFYTKESYKNYLNTLKRAQSVYDSEFATQEEVDKATEDVYKAEKSLVEVTVTKEVLTSLIQEFEAKHPAENYSEKGWTRFLINLNYAKAAADDTASSQELLRKAYQDLILEEMLLADDPGPSKQTTAGEISVNNFDVSVGSAQPGQGADQAIDDDASTVWHTSWGGAPLEDSWFKFTLKSPETVDGLKYLPRASGSNGKITKYEIYVKKENEENYTLAASGDWTTNTEWKVVEFKEIQENVKEVVLLPIATVGDSPDFFTSAAELRITGPIKADQPAPTGLKSTPDSSRENAAGNGIITNVSPDMEYSNELFGTYQPIEGTEITGLKAGDYYVRYKGNITTKDSLPTKVTVFSVKTPDPTPVPSTPTPTPTEVPKEDTSDKVIIEAGDSSITVEVKVETTEEGAANTTVVIPEEEAEKLIETATKEEPIDVAIPVPNDKLVELLEKEEVKTATTTIIIPTNILETEYVTVSKVTLDSKVLTAVKNAGKDLTVEVKSSEEKVLYTWEIKAEDMKNATQTLKDINLHITIAAETKDYTSKKTESINISVAQQGILPVQASVKVFVGTGKEFVNKKVYVYHKNEEGKLETLPFSYKYKVDKDGYVDLSILQGGEYVVLQEPADRSVVINFAEQIKISKTKYLKVGKNVNMNVQLPITLEKTKTIKDKTKSDAVGAVTITYQSSNPAVAVVDEEGNITPVNSGKAKITTTVTYYTGVKRTYKTNVSVK